MKPEESPKTIFEIQPAFCRAPLPKKEIQWSDWHKGQKGLVEKIERVIYLDPTELYARIGHLINPFKRHQSIGMENLFPKQHLYCACGCGEKAKASDTFKEDGITPTWQRKWKDDMCKSFANNVLSIINNTFQTPSKHLAWYSGKICDECKDPGKQYGLELDHIVGVKQGGGGCWLSNYRWLCKDCHVSKTTKDRREHSNKIKRQLKADL